MARDHHLLNEASHRPPEGDDEDDDVPFGSWRVLYIAVIAYTLGLIGILYIATRLLDHSGP